MAAEVVILRRLLELHDRFGADSFDVANDLAALTAAVAPTDHDDSALNGPRDEIMHSAHPTPSNDGQLDE